MTGDRKNIDNLFRDSLKGYRQPPPVHSWGRLEESLDAVQSRRKVLFFRLAAASILVLMAFGAGFFYATYMRPPADVADREVPVEIQKDQPSVAVGDESPADGDVLLEPSTPGQAVPPGPAPEDESGGTGPDVPARQAEFAFQPVAPDAGLAVLPDDGSMVSAMQKTTQPMAAMAFINPASVELMEPAAARHGTASTDPRPVNLEGLLYYPEDYGLADKTRNASWAVGAQFAPIYSYREISANYGADLSSNQQNVRELNEVEEGLLSYSGGVDVGYNFSKRWSMQSGVYFSRIGQVNSDALEFKQSKDEFLLYGINTSTGQINIAFERVPENVRKFDAPKDSIGAGALADVKVIQNFDLFEVPLLIRYKFLDRKFSMNFSGGLSPAYLLANNTYLELEENKYDVGDAGNLNSMIVNTSIGMGFAYSVTRALSLNFEPTFKYALNPINNNSNINYHPYSFTWFTGIRLKID